MVVGIVGALFILGWLFIGVALWVYRAHEVPERLKEIESAVSEAAAAKYCEIFAPCRKPDEPALEQLLGLFRELHSPRSYRLAGAALLLASGGSLALGYVWAYRALTGAGDLPFDVTLLLALAGAYVWSVGELLDRKSGGDLTPAEIFRIALRFLYAVPVGYAFSLLAGAGEIAGLFAFAASSFPLKQVRRTFQKYAQKTTQEDVAPGVAAGEALLGRAIQGASRETRVRLDEVGIRTCVDLAYADPIALMARTGLPLRPLIDWMDQALLALYTGEHLIEFRKRGIRGGLEAWHLYEQECLDARGNLLAGAKNKERIKEIAGVLEIGPAFVISMLAEVSDDPHLEFISLVWGEQAD